MKRKMIEKYFKPGDPEPEFWSCQFCKHVEENPPFDPFKSQIVVDQPTGYGNINPEHECRVMRYSRPGYVLRTLGCGFFEHDNERVKEVLAGKRSYWVYEQENN